jgi:predicted nucleic acid-binding protein
MTGRILVDSNILVYAYDRSEPVKQAQAANLLDQLLITGAGILSTQVLAEFFVAVTRKITKPLSIEQALGSLENYAASWEVLGLNSMNILEAARGVRDHEFSYYDAQIWAVARMNQIPVILSEDFNPSWIEGVQFVNPFAPDFILADWV